MSLQSEKDHRFCHKRSGPGMDLLAIFIVNTFGVPHYVSLCLNFNAKL